MSLETVVRRRKKQGIYSITIEANNSIYIGQSVDIMNRWSSHRSCLRQGHHQNSRVQRVFDKYGEASLSFAVVENCAKPTTPEHLTDREEWWITHFKALGKIILNQRIVVSSNFGFKHTLESRQKLSRALTGRKLSADRVEAMRQRQLGTKHSPETRAKMSASQKARPHPSPEQCAAISKRQKGRKMSESSCRKMSEIRTGVKRGPHSDNHKAKIGNANAGKFSLVSPSGERVEVSNLCKFCRENGLDQAHLYKVKSGQQKTHKGWKFA